MRLVISMFAICMATSADAHVGHLAEAAGHGHWLGAAALGAAIAIGLAAGLRGKKQTDDHPEASDFCGDQQEEELGPAQVALQVLAPPDQGHLRDRRCISMHLTCIETHSPCCSRDECLTRVPAAP